LEIDDAVTYIGRDTLLTLLHAENVIARRYFYPGCHRMEPYRSFFPNAHLLLPQTEQVARRVLILPNGQTVGAPEIDAICGIIRYALAHAAEIKATLNQRTG
jgi:dTDP-4-amino-4,6-dideoxygalactose transaminase